MRNGNGRWVLGVGKEQSQHPELKNLTAIRHSPGVVQMRKLSRPAVGVLAAFVVLASLGSAPTRGAGDGARSRAERAARDGDFEAAEKIYRELLSKDSHDNGSRLGLSY